MRFRAKKDTEESREYWESVRIGAKVYDELPAWKKGDRMSTKFVLRYDGDWSLTFALYKEGKLMVERYRLGPRDLAEAAGLDYTEVEVVVEEKTNGQP
jgi:hypothetical protein